MRGSSFQKSQRAESEIRHIIALKDYAESRMKALLSDRKSEFHNRGTITNMSRDAHPDFLLYRHVKIKPVKFVVAPTPQPEISSPVRSVSPVKKETSVREESSPSVMGRNKILDFKTLNNQALLNKAPPAV